MGGRRINIGWLLLPPLDSIHAVSALSLPRHLTWHAKLQQLMHSPVEEQVALRGTQLLASKPISLGPNDSLWFSNWSADLGKQAEVVVKLARPNASTIFGLEVMAGSIHKGDEGNHSTRIFLNYVVGQDAVQVGITSGNTGLPIINSGPRSSLKLLKTDVEIELRVFVDHTLVEVYWMDGRVAMSSRLLGACHTTAGMKLFNTASPVAIRQLNVWFVKSIWVSPEYVLNMRRQSPDDHMII